MNPGRNFMEEIFGKTLSDKLAGTAISTDGLQRFSTKALIGELQRRLSELEAKQAENAPVPKFDQWLPIADITAKYFKGLRSGVIATYLFMIGHPYRLQRKSNDGDLSTEKIFLEDSMQRVAEAFEKNSLKLDCDGAVGKFLHPIVGRYERAGCTGGWKLG